MRKSILTFIFIISLFAAYSQQNTNNSEFNFGFEKTTPNEKLPDKWFQWGTGYDLITDTITKHTGRNSILIQPSGDKQANSYGSIAYNIPAIYEGDSLELKAYLKLNKVKDGAIGLMLRVDGSSGVLAFTNTMQKKIQGTIDWTMYSVKVPLPRNAKTIIIGVLLSGIGQLWADDFELLIDGENFQKAKPKEIKEFGAEKDIEFDKGSRIVFLNPTEEKINDLKVLGMVWGFLKYYHPSIAAGLYNWDYELFRVLPQIIDAKNSIDRDMILTNWIKKLGDIEESKDVVNNEKEVIIKPDLDWINNLNLTTELVSLLKNVKNAKRGNDSYYIDIAANIGNPIFNNEKPYLDMKYPDTGFRLLSLYRYWNIIHYFFPYKDLIGEDWKGVLNEFIPKFINAKNETEYKLTTLELITRIHDTHANIWGQDETFNKYWGENYSPLRISFIEEQVVVVGYFDKELGERTELKIGDIITKINNKPVQEIVKHNLTISPASNYPTKLRNIAKSILRSNDTLIQLEFKRNGQSETKYTKVYKANKFDIYKELQKPDSCFTFINPNIGYLFLGSIKANFLPKIMEEIKNTKGLIIDLRCYPSEFVVFSLGQYLMPDTTPFVKFTSGSITSPGLFTMSPNLKVGKKNNDYYKGKVVIIINEKTQSQAEYTTMAFRVAPKATVIGSTTAGADGNVSPFSLPGGISTMISGLGVYYPNGKGTQRVGIIPDIIVKPTIMGIINGKDELLEVAINIINKK